MTAFYDLCYMIWVVFGQDKSCTAASSLQEADKFFAYWSNDF